MKTLWLALGLALSLGVTSAEPTATSLLAPGQIDPARLLPPPPAPGSAEAQAEIAELKQVAASRTADDLAEAIRDDKDESGDTFADAIGTGFDLAKLPATARLLKAVGAAEEVASKDAKAFFKRPRPWIVIPGWQTCAPHKDGPALNSYPSGHATIAYAMGVVLAALMPQKAQAILASSARFAQSRIVCGVHYRSDLAAGQTLGTVLAIDLLENQSFHAEFDAAAAELSAAHLR
jgi:acid phosphatase (class A)